MEKRIFVDMGPRYFEDSDINGEPDISEDEQFRVKAHPRMPLTEWSDSDREYRWRFEVTEDGVIKGWPEGNTANVHYKVCDECRVRVEEDGEMVVDYDDYVPKFLDPLGKGIGDYDGDYVRMDINAFGQITPWHKEDLLSFVAKYRWKA